jgi:hypothetical protein
MMSAHAPPSVLILWTVVSGTFTTEATVYGVNMTLACSTTLIFDCVRVPMAVTIQVSKNVDYLKGTLVYAHPLPSSSPSKNPMHVLVAVMLSDLRGVRIHMLLLVDIQLL